MPAEELRQVTTLPTTGEHPPDSTPRDVLLLLARRVLPDVEAALRAVYPHEGCGYVTKSGVVVPCRNRLSDGAEDLSDKPARCAFVFAADDAIRLAESFDSADPAVILYHAHIGAGAALSLEDRLGLTIRRNTHDAPILMWPGLACLVVALSNRVPIETILYILVDSPKGPCISGSCSLGPPGDCLQRTSPPTFEQAAR